MNDPERTTIVILGAGKGGSAILELFTHLPGVEIVGIADKNPSAPALLYARQHQIPVTQDPLTLIRRHGINLIVNVTGDPTIDSLVAEHKPPETEVLGGAASKVLWDLVLHQSQMQSQLFQAEKLAGIGTFASGIAHDINNPLYIMIAFAENMLEETDLTVIREQAQRIVSAGKRIQGICGNITQYARAAKVMDPTPIEVNTKLNEALTIARYATILQDLDIHRNYSGKLEVLANPEELLQVFVNLMTNAIHAMDGKGTLALSSWSEDGLAKISITDSGCGIPPEKMEKIFEPFYTTKPAGKGTGLGLQNVKAIVNKYQGDLKVKSQVGKGTTFLIELPNATKE